MGGWIKIGGSNQDLAELKGILLDWMDREPLEHDCRINRGRIVKIVSYLEELQDLRREYGDYE